MILCSAIGVRIKIKTFKPLLLIYNAWIIHCKCVASYNGEAEILLNAQSIENNRHQ